MKLKVKGKEQELKFDMGFIRRLDEIHSIKIDVMGAGDDMAFGVGLVYADIQLKQYSPVMLSDVIRAATNCSRIDADKAIEDYAEENGSLEKLFDGVIDGLKKVASRKNNSDEDGGLTKKVTYEDIALNCFIYLGLKSFTEVDRLYWKEYLLLMKAAAIKELNKERDIHLLAYLPEIAGQRKRQGKTLVPVYKNFKEFYDYEGRRKELLNEQPTKKEQKIRNIMVQANQL